MDHIPIGEHPEEPDNVVRLPGAEDSPSPTDDEMSYEEAIAADAEADDEDDAPPGPLPGSQVAGLVEQGVRVGAGLFAAGASAFADALRSTMPRDEETTGQKDPAATLAGAGLGAAVAAAEAAAGAATQMAETIGPAITWLVEPRFAKDASEMAAGAARVLDGQWKATQAEMVEAATSFLGVLVPEIAQGLADQVDLTALVRERVDVNAIVEDVDIDRILDRVDLEAVIDRIDIDAIVAKVDVERHRGAGGHGAPRRVVPGRTIVDRVDVDRVIARTDIVGDRRPARPGEIAQEVIDEVDLPRAGPRVVRAMASETVQTVRVQGMNADRLVSHVVDKVLRREARDCWLPTSTGGAVMSGAIASRSGVFPAGAGERQGLRAGVVSRTVAMVIDMAYVAAMLGIGYLGVAGFRFLRSPRSFTWPQTSLPQVVVVGRHRGGDRAHDRLDRQRDEPRGCGSWVCGCSGRRGVDVHTARAFLRAVTCVAFPLGLFWSAVSKRNASVQDLLFGTSVVYDWHMRVPVARADRPPPTATGQRSSPRVRGACRRCSDRRARTRRSSCRTAPPPRPPATTAR